MVTDEAGTMVGLALRAMDGFGSASEAHALDAKRIPTPSKPLA